MLSPHYISPQPNDLISLNNIHLNITNSCGYCSTKLAVCPKSWSTTGFSCPQMSTETYQILLEKGWRRCGTYYYKPDLSKCCCRPYTIRLPVLKYKIRSSHLSSLKKFQAFLKENDPPFNKEPPEYDIEAENLVFELFEAIRTRFTINGKGMGLMRVNDQDKIKITATYQKQKKFQRTCNLIWLVYSVNEALIKEEGLDFKVFKEKLSFFITDFMKNKEDKLKLRCHNSGYISIKLKEIIKDFNVQEFIEETLTKINPDFEIKLVPAEFQEESFEIYHKYSKIIHNIVESRNSYKNFLCMQALSYTEEKTFSLKYGCFHMKYYFEKKLIAIGVVDILPKGLSSVYFFYDPDYKKRSMGVIGSLKELNFVYIHNKLLPNFEYYYMGYYIQSSKKMKYKGDFEPSELLCPKTGIWVDLNEKTKAIIKEHREDPVIYEEKIEEKNDEKINEKEKNDGKNKEKDEEKNNEKNTEKNTEKNEYFIDKSEEFLTKEHFMRKKLFFIDEWVSIGDLQKRNASHFIETMMGLGRVLGREVLDRMHFTIL